MKLYQTTCTHAGVNTHHFDSSAADASKSRTAMKAQFPGVKPVSEQKEVLQTRESILQFLNELCAPAASSEAEPK